MKHSDIDISLPSMYEKIFNIYNPNKQFIIEKIIDVGKEECAKIPIEDIINEIQEFRSRNNKNWMDILRLAFKYAPDEAKKIMADITNCDFKINELSKKLSEE